MLIETALVAPMLVLLALGGFEVSSIIARQTELQSAVAEAAAVVRAAIPEDQESRNAIRDVVKESTGLTSDQVSVTETYRCGTGQTYTNTADTCGSGAPEYKFVRVSLTDVYTPIWTHFGVSSPMTFTVTRTIQIG